ncbi:MAG TPA: GGDEF domain-containing protein [Solirubrobacteraceae bacterium]|jgi:diguanylate cyclase (GGDEF)-like protein
MTGGAQASWLDRLGGLAISEERRLAGRIAGALYLIGAGTALTMLVLPHVERSHWPVVVALALAGALWGVACLTVVPWERAPSAVSHLSTFAGFPIAITVVAATGGASSPARFYGLFIVIYAAYFYGPREAMPYVAGVMAMQMLPLAYDGSATAGAYLAETVVLAPTYAVLGALLIAGKSVLVRLRDDATALAHRDPLTGLANRRALMETLERHVGGRRSREHLGLVLLDLDNFKDVNTTFGHQGGDRALAAAGHGLLGAARESDVVARLGGDEFAVVALDLDEPALRELAERLVAAVRSAFDDLALPGVRVTASAGYAGTPADATTVEGLIGVADAAMRTAKLVGKDCAAPPLRLAAAS